MAVSLKTAFGAADDEEVMQMAYDACGFALISAETVCTTLDAIAVMEQRMLLQKVSRVDLPFTKALAEQRAKYKGETAWTNTTESQ
jgi:hypothetical protein